MSKEIEDLKIETLKMTEELAAKEAELKEMKTRLSAMNVKLGVVMCPVPMCSRVSVKGDDRVIEIRSAQARFVQNWSGKYELVWQPYCERIMPDGQSQRAEGVTITLDDFAKGNVAPLGNDALPERLPLITQICGLMRKLKIGHRSKSSAGYMTLNRGRECLELSIEPSGFWERTEEDLENAQKLCPAVEQALKEKGFAWKKKTVDAGTIRYSFVA